MCGVLTFVSAHRAASLHRDPIAQALETLHHRGPDDTGVELVGDDAVVGFKRLSIIDVEHSHQPLWYLDRRYAIAYNGEIYNYQELRAELVTDFDANFATDGDTEVIVAAYHYWGPDALHRLRGMFSFVIWDTLKQRAFGARDPFGIKPLYYLETDDGVYFGSEKKALLPFAPTSKIGDAGIDTPNLQHYLTLQYVPEPGSLHRGINRIGSGESFTYEPGHGLDVRRYFTPQFRPMPATRPAALYQRIQQTLRESVRLHMRSDVPVGAFLSSGIDSTAVVALAREINPNLLTFTAALEVDGYSELAVAEASAKALGVANHPIVVTPQMMMDALPRVVWHLDDPVADPSLVPLYFVARKAAEQVTVVLSGEGSDEFFGGYTIYREPLSLRSVTSLPEPARRGLAAVSRAIPEGMKGKSFLQRGTTAIEERYYGNARMFPESEKARVLRRYDPGVHYTDVTGPVYDECRDLDDVTKMQYVDLYTWLRGDILVKADRMSMAHSLELRVPFLDREVFDVAATIPVSERLPARTTETKYALRQALRGIVPDEIVNRVKLGFPTPIRVWLRAEMYEWAQHILTTSGAGDLIDLSYVLGLLEAHRRGDADHSRKIWTVLVFCTWHAIFITGTLDPGIERAESALSRKPQVARVVA